MRMRNESKHTVAVGAAVMVVSMASVASADDAALNLQVEGEAGAELAAAFQADVARMESEMNLAASAQATSTAVASGIHGRVLGISKMKTLVVRKNSDGTFSVSHIANADDIEEFIATDNADGVEEE